MTIFFFIFNDFSPSRPLIYPPFSDAFPTVIRPLSVLLSDNDPLIGRMR